MVITQPTVDDFSDTTVMRVIRKIVNYICNDLIDGVNNNDIVSGKFSVRGNQLSGTLTKGDGTAINIPAVTLPDGGGGSDNPYPTGVDLSVSGSKLSINIPMSGSTALTDSVTIPTGDNITEYSTFSTVVSNAQLGDVVTVFHLEEDSYGFSFTGVCINASGSGSTKDILFSGSGMLVELTDGTQKPLNALSMTPSVMLPLAFTKIGNRIGFAPVKNGTTTTPDNIRLIHFE